MTKNDIKSSEVVCLATGTKSLSGNYMSRRGESVHDCHAEVLTRRCLMKYFYHELHKSVKGNPSIFVADQNRQRFKVSKDITFHLYISTAPCGVVREFSFSGTDGHPNQPNRFGILRSKIEHGLSTVSVHDQEVQTYDAVAGGERLITMSCSDKVTRWNVLGLQGSLLSNFIVGPVYLASISIGSEFNARHVKRTIYSRVENVISRLPQDYE